LFWHLVVLTLLTVIAFSSCAKKGSCPLFKCQATSTTTTDCVTSTKTNGVQTVSFAKCENSQQICPYSFALAFMNNGAGNDTTKCQNKPVQANTTTKRENLVHKETCSSTNGNTECAFKKCTAGICEW